MLLQQKNKSNTDKTANDNNVKLHMLGLARLVIERWRVQVSKKKLKNVCKSGNQFLCV